ncbi:MAG: D-glycero-beta-D-manno-heptose-7-phosphate kinase [Candidatus Cloacimonetes bacterium HGW-Cloacimonetes-1]|jgi:D-beta-D-heptose 7-phosphate kinase/D-beta-D-heptose 1-phosphate adenosyltransferase|nr:MAG: D-glycero-beta-D-manno-heptose-7-phosphate kinase [Candidatus Cloacimonetes bacterium HGW-Cloacimonetes-1]
MISNTIKSFTHKKILVVGDVMLDHYIKGNVERISPEAPVPVVDVHTEEYRLGGAANVALNLKSLGAEPVLVGIIGEDENRDVLLSLMEASKLSTRGLFTVPDRGTTLKTRISAGNQQIVRLDFETKSYIDADQETRLMKFLETHIEDCDAIIIEDYNKGMLTSAIISGLVQDANRLGKIIAVDPKFKHFFDYKNVDVFKPNFAEMQKNLGLNFESDEDFMEASNGLKHRIEARNLIVTRGSMGMYIFSQDGAYTHIPTFAKEVYDVSGAGDTVISVLTLALSCGHDIVSAAIIANHAAGVVCGKQGTATLTTQELLDAYNAHR